MKRLHPWRVAVAFFMESLDTTIVNTAVPDIANALAVAPLSMKAVLSSYMLRCGVHSGQRPNDDGNAVSRHHVLHDEG